jgi:hypothetical protein
MIMKKILLVILLLTSSLFYSQVINNIDNKFSIKLNPLALIDPYGSYSYRIGSEFKIYRNYALSIEVGKYFNYAKNDGVRDNVKGYIIKPEIKYYINDNNLTSGQYFSLEYQYKETSFNYNDSIKITPQPAYSRDYKINKTISIINLKCGQLKVYQNRFVYEWFVGVGVRICRGYNSLSEIENNGILTGEGHGSGIGRAQRNINYVLPNLTIGFKIGYSFR